MRCNTGNKESLGDTVSRTGSNVPLWLGRQNILLDSMDVMPIQYTVGVTCSNWCYCNNQDYYVSQCLASVKLQGSKGGKWWEQRSLESTLPLVLRCSLTDLIFNCNFLDHHPNRVACSQLRFGRNHPSAPGRVIYSTSGCCIHSRFVSEHAQGEKRGTNLLLMLMRNKCVVLLFCVFSGRCSRSCRSSGLIL